MSLLGKRVYLPHLKQYGKVVEVEGELVSKVSIKRPSGRIDVISVLNKVVILVGLVDKIINWWRDFRKEFRLKKLKRLKAKIGKDGI